MFKKSLIAFICALLPGCDQAPTIVTLVDRKAAMDDSILMSMSAKGGIPTEIHGAPFTGIHADQVAAALRLPARFPAGITFRAIAPGSWSLHHPLRLVLIFNGTEAPAAPIDCKHRTPAPTRANEGPGFKVFALICRGEDWLAHGHLHAPHTSATDQQGFTKAMVQLFAEMFPVHQNSQR